MNTRRLPPALVMALGLGCGDDGSGGETTTGPCLIAPLTESAEGPSTDTDASDTSTSACLSPPTSDTLTTSESTPSTSGSSGSSSDSGTDTDTDSTSVGPCLEPPLTTSGSSDSSSTGMGDALPDRDAVVDKVIERGVLPPDVAAKLRR